MDAYKGLMESVTSGLTVLYDTTWAILASLQQDGHPLEALLSQPFPYMVALTVSVGALLFYYYLWLPTNRIKDFSDFGYHHINVATHERGAKDEVVKGIRRRRYVGELPPIYPNGWFALLESSDLKTSQVQHVQALGENFAVMRTTAGQVHVLDAYCPHLGANLAVGGVVRGDCLECPFHGWQFRGEDGVCSHIPYSDKVPKTAVVKRWTSDEVNGFVFVWYHAEGTPPSWRIPSIPEIESGRMWYCGRNEFYINNHFQESAENIADVTHFNVIHSASAFAGSDLSTQNRLVHSFLKLDWVKMDWQQHSAPGEEHMCTLIADTDITLFKKYKLSTRCSNTTQIGPGYTVLFSGNRFYTLFCNTQVEPMMTKVVIHCYCYPSLFIFGRLLLYVQSVMFGRDVMVWNHKKHHINPHLIKEDEFLKTWYRWFSQFYSANSPRISSQRDPMAW